MPCPASPPAHTCNGQRRPSNTETTQRECPVLPGGRLGQLDRLAEHPRLRSLSAPSAGSWRACRRRRSHNQTCRQAEAGLDPGLVSRWAWRGRSQISDSAAPLPGSCTSAPNVLENRDAYYAHERRCGSVAATSRAAAGRRPSLPLADTNAATRPGQEVVSRAGGVRRHSRPTRGAARHRHRWCTDRAAIAGVSRRAGRWSAQPHP